MNILFLATDAFGGRGGIAYYNRCLAEALAEMPEVREVTLLPRLIEEAPDSIPGKVCFIQEAAVGKWGYVIALAKLLKYPCRVVICGHINLLPLAAVYCLVTRAQLVLQVHGIEVWEPPTWVLRAFMGRVDAVWSVSTHTCALMNEWARLARERYTLMPNTIRLESYGLAPKRADLVERYGLRGREVIITLARLDPRERYKGIDEVIRSLPVLLAERPELRYIIAGEGHDRTRLAELARQMGVEQQVIFTGFVPEAEKADLIRLADVFAMPGRGEGFGIVYLEAMACGIPVVGSQLDGSREALRDGLLGELADPDDQDSIRQAILKALAKPKVIPPGLGYFAWPAFAERVAAAVRHLLVPASTVRRPPSVGGITQ